MDIYKVTLEAARRNKRLSQDQVAAQMGTTRATIHNWESGKTKIDAESLTRLCDIYEVPMQHINLQSVSTSA